ncbi:MAG: RNA polymerase sigma factor [Planctomycetota bacterium]
MDNTDSHAFLDVISTRWSQVDNPPQFVKRYAPAIRRYLVAILKDMDAAEEVSQDFLVRVLDKSFQVDRIKSGRFRDYLKAALRNTAMSYLRRKPLPKANTTELECLVSPAQDSREDPQWTANWRKCIIERVWSALEAKQRSSEGCYYHTVLKYVSEHPNATSQMVADHVGEKIGRPYRADACRQQYARARRAFADLIVLELRDSLADSSFESLEAELIELDLMKYVRDYLR